MRARARMRTEGERRASSASEHDIQRIDMAWHGSKEQQTGWTKAMRYASLTENDNSLRIRSSR